MSQAQATPEMNEPKPTRGELFGPELPFWRPMAVTNTRKPGTCETTAAKVVNRRVMGTAVGGVGGPSWNMHGELVVCKFGGTSVGDLERVRGVAERLVALQRDGHRVVAVLSAMGATTDHLVELARRISNGPQPRELDALLSLGESMSCALAALTVHELGARAVSLTAAQAGIVTDDAHGCAQLDEIRPHRILEAVADGRIVFVAGFQGVSRNGDVTTLGRGGSDASAVALAAALGLRRCEIFTDVTGVFTADPRVVPEARRLGALSHEEMLLLAAAGATVMQPRAVELALANDIDIHVRSTFAAEGGTLISKENRVLEQTRMTGVAHRSRERLYAVCDVSPAVVSAALARRGSAIGSLVRCGNEVRFTAPSAAEADIDCAMRAVGADLHVGEELGAVSVVGIGIGTRPEIAAQALAVLEGLGVDPQLVTSTPGAISFHVSSTAVHEVARMLHDAFGLHESTRAESPATPDDHRKAGARRGRRPQSRRTATLPVP